MAKQIEIKDDKYDMIKTALKSITYTVLGTAATGIVQFLGKGLDLKEAIFYGVAFGISAGVKNFGKHYLKIDVDFAKLKK